MRNVSVFFPSIQWKLMVTKLFGSHIIKISSFLFCKGKLCIQVWNDMGEQSLRNIITAFSCKHCNKECKYNTVAVCKFTFFKLLAYNFNIWYKTYAPTEAIWCWSIPGHKISPRQKLQKVLTPPAEWYNVPFRTNDQEQCERSKKLTKAILITILIIII